MGLPVPVGPLLTDAGNPPTVTVGAVLVSTPALASVSVMGMVRTVPTDPGAEGVMVLMAPVGGTLSMVKPVLVMLALGFPIVSVALMVTVSEAQAVALQPVLLTFQVQV